MPLTHITTCLLCDPMKPKEFAAIAIPEIQVGQQPPPEIVRFLSAIASHVAKAHPEAFVSIQQMGSLFQSMLLMKNFRSTDPGLTSAANVARHFIHKLTQREPVTDQQIIDRFESILDDSATGGIRAQDLIELRNWLLEEGMYAPKPQEVGGVVTA